MIVRRDDRFLKRRQCERERMTRMEVEGGTWRKMYLCLIAWRGIKETRQSLWKKEERERINICRYMNENNMVSSLTHKYFL